MRRKTVKRGREKNQRGGGKWSTFDTTTKAQWQPLLRELKLEGLLVDSDFQTDDARKARLEAYINALEQQDELYESAYKLILKTYGVPEGISPSEWIIDNLEQFQDSTDEDNNTKQRAVRYTLMEVGKFIGFVPPFLGKKLENIDNKSIIEFLVYPERLQNLLVQAIAHLIITFKSDPTLLEKIMKITDEQKRNILIELLAKQNAAYIRSLALTTTSQDVQDSLYIGMNPLTGNDIVKFWIDTLRHIINLYSKKPVDLFKKVDGDEYQLVGERRADGLNEMAFVVANMFVYYKNDSLDNLFTYLSKVSTIRVKKEKPDLEMQSMLAPIPPQDFIDIPLVKLNGGTINQLLSIMTIRQLSFMLHLRYTIQKFEKATATP